MTKGTFGGASSMARMAALKTRHMITSRKQIQAQHVAIAVLQQNTQFRENCKEKNAQLGCNKTENKAVP